ncbi:hypothetical protein ACFPMF_15345 [Larkinella bovis]|uniref:CopG family transcriptional regulator n=1 Tax=Larkinella bovis TaxID=683041 RepID=A0ABW0IF04_9BACT
MKKHNKTFAISESDNSKIIAMAEILGEKQVDVLSRAINYLYDNIEAVSAEALKKRSEEIKKRLSGLK